MNDKDYLDTILMELEATGATARWTIRNAVEGVQIFGGIGSGKTSGSGRMLALKYLAAGFGGLVLTAKPDEKELWEKYCAIAGRSKDLLIVEPGRENYFNFLDYESHGSSGSAMTENIVQVLKTVINASEEQSGKSGQDPFWETALDMLIFNVIDLCKLARGRVSVQDMYDVVQSLPKGGKKTANNKVFDETYEAAARKVAELVEQWKATATDDFNSQQKIIYDAVSEARLLDFIDQFIFSFTNLSEKTRSVIDFTFSGFLFRLLRDPVYSLFCKHASTFTPEDSLNGKIILINLPVKLYHKVGRDSQIMFKYIWQRAMEKRQVNDFSRPVFLWADEAQNFLHEHDADYQATARSSRIATVYISQNLPNYHACMGGDKSEYRVKSFLGTLNTKIFHANADIETNRYASELIGDKYYDDVSQTTSVSKDPTFSNTVTQKIERIVRPEQFPKLLTGGVSNRGLVVAYAHFQGSVIDNGANHMPAFFDQNFTPNLKPHTHGR